MEPAFTQLSLEFASVERLERAGGAPGKRRRGAIVRRVRLTLGEAARITREAVKEKSYRKMPLGQPVGRYLRWFRNEYGATDSRSATTRPS